MHPVGKKYFQKSAYYPYIYFLHSCAGYSVTTISDGSAEYFVAGAPRSNHSGQVLVYTINAQKQAAVIDSQRGKQVPTL